jgi:hypothetical protein
VDRNQDDNRKHGPLPGLMETLGGLHRKLEFEPISWFILAHRLLFSHQQRPP